MNLTDTEQRILAGVRALTPESKSKVLAYIEGLKAQSRGVLTDELIMRFAGTLPDEDAEEMRRAIEEDCERIDRDGW